MNGKQARNLRKTYGTEKGNLKETKSGALRYPDCQNTRYKAAKRAYKSGAV